MSRALVSLLVLALTACSSTTSPKPRKRTWHVEPARKPATPAAAKHKSHEHPHGGHPHGPGPHHHHPHPHPHLDGPYGHHHPS